MTMKAVRPPNELIGIVPDAVSKNTAVVTAVLYAVAALACALAGRIPELPASVWLSAAGVFATLSGVTFTRRDPRTPALWTDLILILVIAIPAFGALASWFAKVVNPENASQADFVILFIVTGITAVLVVAGVTKKSHDSVPPLSSKRVRKLMASDARQKRIYGTVLPTDYNVAWITNATPHQVIARVAYAPTSTIAEEITIEPGNTGEGAPRNKRRIVEIGARVATPTGDVLAHPYVSAEGSLHADYAVIVGQGPDTYAVTRIVTG